SADANHRDPIVRLGLGNAKPAPHRVSGAENRSCLLIAEPFGNQLRRIREGDHVLGVAALGLNSRSHVVRTQLPFTALAPFPSATGSLHPGNANPVTDSAGRKPGSKLHNRDYGLLTAGSGKLSRRLS